jgi:copper chaperone CopZ
MAQSTPLQFIVPDMSCESAVASIRISVRRLDQDASVAADLATKQVIVGSTRGADEIAHAIEDAGFTVKAA